MLLSVAASYPNGSRGRPMMTWFFRYVFVTIAVAVCTLSFSEASEKTPFTPNNVDTIIGMNIDDVVFGSHYDSLGGFLFKNRFSITHYRQKETGHNYFFVQRIVKSHRTSIVTDIIQFREFKEFETLGFLCVRKEKRGVTEVIAVANIKNDTEYYDVIVEAWKIDGLGRTAVTNKDGVLCVNEGYGV